MTEQIIIWSAVLLLCFSGIMLLDILIQRRQQATIEAKQKRQREELMPALVAYINDDLPLDRMLKHAADDSEAAEPLILDFLHTLSGTPRKRLVLLAQVLGLIDAALAQTSSPDWTVRDMAVTKLGTYAVPEAVSALTQRLEDRSPEVRFTAARSLGLLGTREALQALLGIIDRPELIDGSRVLEIVQSMARCNMEPLRMVLGSEAFPQQSKLLAIDLAGDVRDYASVGQLHEILHSSDKEKVVRAMRALGRIGHPASVYQILGRVGHPDWEVRAQAVKAIGALQIDEGIELLQWALTDDSYWVRRNAAEALLSFGEPGIRLLDEARRKADNFTQDIAHYQLEKVAAA